LQKQKATAPNVSLVEILNPPHPHKEQNKSGQFVVVYAKELKQTFHGK
jgi:hypothetical protein